MEDKSNSLCALASTSIPVIHSNHARNQEMSKNMSNYWAKSFAFATLLLLSSLSQAAASNSLREMCARARGSVVEKAAPSAYLDSRTNQNPDSRLTFRDGGTYQFLDAHDDGILRTQANRLRTLARIAYFTGSPVNMCVYTGTSPHTVWILEVAN